MVFRNSSCPDRYCSLVRHQGRRSAAMLRDWLVTARAACISMKTARVTCCVVRHPRHVCCSISRASSGLMSSTSSTWPSCVGKTNLNLPWATFLSRCIAVITSSWSTLGTSVGNPSAMRSCSWRSVSVLSMRPTFSARRDAHNMPMETASP